MKNRVLLICTSAGCDVDISLGIPGYEEEVMKRAVDYDLGNGKVVKLCSAEDLIIHKAVAGRPQDCSDIEGVILRQGKQLKVSYIRYWLKNFSEALEMEEVYQRFSLPWKRLTKQTDERRRRK